MQNYQKLYFLRIFFCSVSIQQFPCYTTRTSKSDNFCHSPNPRLPHSAIFHIPYSPFRLSVYVVPYICPAVIYLNRLFLIKIPLLKYPFREADTRLVNLSLQNCGSVSGWQSGSTRTDEHFREYSNGHHVRHSQYGKYYGVVHITKDTLSTKVLVLTAKIHF